MAKKLLVTLFTITSALCIALGVAACGGENPDSAAANKDFVEYRKKVVTILDDNGIHVNDYDGVLASAEAQHTHSVVALGYKLNSGSISSLIENDKTKTEYKSGIQYSRLDLFTQTIFMSLYLGDGITTYFNVTNFYGIAVKLESWQQYFEIVKEGEKDVINVYSAAEQGRKEQFMRLAITYNSVSDYEYYFIVVTEDMGEVQFAYGNAQKQFLKVSYSQTDEEQNYVYYASSANDGWAIEDSATVSSCYELIKDEFNSIDISHNKSLKNADYSLTAGHISDLNKKYFGHDIGVADWLTGAVFMYDRQQSPMLINGKKLLIYYIGEGESTVQLPTDEQYYIASDFYVYNAAEKFTLNVPANVIGVMRLKEGAAETDEPASWQAAAVSEFYPWAYGEDGNRDVYGKFNVAKGSSLFEAGQGHLKDKDGNLLCYADYAVDELDLSYLTHQDYMDCLPQYTTLLRSISTQSVNLNELYALERDGYNISLELNETIGAMSGLETLKFISADAQAQSTTFYPEFTITHNVAIDVEMTNPNFKVDMRVYSDVSNTLTFNLNGIARTDSLFYCIVDSARATAKVNVNICSEQWYNNFYKPEGRFGPFSVFANSGEVQYSYNADGAEGKPIDGMQFSRSQSSLEGGRESALAVTLPELQDGQTFTVPESAYGIPVQEIIFDSASLDGKTVTVKIEGDVYAQAMAGCQKMLIFTGDLFNENLTVVTDNTWDDFYSVVLVKNNAFAESIYDTWWNISFTLQCADKTALYETYLFEDPNDTKEYFRMSIIDGKDFTRYGDIEYVSGEYAVIDIQQTLDLKNYMYLLVEENYGVSPEREVIYLNVADSPYADGKITLPATREVDYTLVRVSPESVEYDCKLIKVTLQAVKGESHEDYSEFTLECLAEGIEMDGTFTEVVQFNIFGVTEVIVHDSSGEHFEVFYCNFEFNSQTGEIENIFFDPYNP